MPTDDAATSATHAAAAEEFYDAHLRRVSRSFAFCIPRLRQPLRNQVAASYLLFRVADTIEDSPFEEGARAELFDLFESLLSRPDHHGAARLARAFQSGATDSERALIDDLPALLAHLHSFDSEVRAAIVTTIHSMMRGMRYFLSRSGGALRLRTVGEVDLYCFFVAGLVGELLSALVAHERGVALGPMLVDAHRFGRFLQKVNILKDAASDLVLGRDLVPSGVEGSLREDAAGALRYILSLPPSADDYRLFCAWSLFLGLFTLARAADAAPARSRREEAEAVLARVAAAAGDDASLRALFLESAATLPPSVPAPPPFVPDARLQGIRTKLTQPELAALGLALPDEVQATPLRS
jgi:farnesyl-diphosphate farnesyltransferase